VKPRLHGWRLPKIQKRSGTTFFESTAMSSEGSATAIEVVCDRCGYDLRAHPAEGQCPECGASIAESHRLAAVPRRPAWGDSDPRWRRRMVAGAGCLALMLLLCGGQILGWHAAIPVPRLFDFHGVILSLHDTLFEWVYQPILFSIGVVLLFSPERGRRAARLDSTRRWGIAVSYVVFILGLSGTSLICGLVTVGIAAVFLSIPAAFQPPSTLFFVKLGTSLVWYGPQPNHVADVLLPVLSAVAILLACIPLRDALRSSGPRTLATILFVALALPAAWQIGYLGYEVAGNLFPRVRVFFGSTNYGDLYYLYYFSPNPTLQPARMFSVAAESASPLRIGIEFVKWGGFLTAAVWLGIAQVAAWRRGRRNEVQPRSS